MEFGKKIALFSIGGAGYVGLECIWRGWSHISMFLAGGSAFLLLGALGRRSDKIPTALRPVAGAGVITAVELAAGLLVNRDYSVWDYRRMPLNFQGQICLPFALLWIPVSAGAMALYRQAEKRIQ